MMEMGRERGVHRGYMNKSISVKTAQVTVKKGEKKSKTKEKEETAQLQVRRRIVSRTQVFSFVVT